MQFRDLKKQYDKLKPEIDKAISDVISNTNFIQGKQVDELENLLSDYVGRRHCIAVGNGTDALELSLITLGVGKGDAVFTSDFTYFASAGTISRVGATPILVDIDLNTFDILPEALEKAILKVKDEGLLVPKAIVPVDLFGLPADYNKILQIANKYNLKVLEDAAQGFGGRIGNKKACSFGNISATSFFPAKPLGCYGDGGAIFTDDDEVDARLRSLRANGKSPIDKYDNREIGTNSRLDTLQAAILIPKFKAFVDYELEAVNNVASKYTERLKDKFITPTILNGFYSSWAQYTILIRDVNERNKLQTKLKANGIPSMVYYPRGIHEQFAYKNMNLHDKDYPNTIEAKNRVLSLPMHPYMDVSDIEKVCEVLLSE